MDILHQLESLIVGAIPTMILFILLVIAYSLLVRRPLVRTLAERRARTMGAVEQARGAMAAAEAETAVYEDKLRAARAQIMAERQSRMAARQAEREQVVAAARDTAQARAVAARAEIEASVESARRQIEGAAEELGERIVRAIMPPRSAGPAEVRQ